jgi:DTW domain-containing protein YfiP
VCARVPRVDNATPVVVLQHPRERVHPIGTTRLVRLGLANVDVRVAWDANAVERVAPAWLPEDAGVLYPSADARDLESTPRSELPGALVVIDGTWHTARTLHRDKKWLHDLPHFKLSPESPSRYRIRKEPTPAAVSTLEAILGALQILEPDLRGAPALLDAFDAMIDEQLGFIEGGKGRPRGLLRRPLASRRLPRFLVEDFDRVVVAYGESARRSPEEPRELVHFGAVRVATGETFERLIRPTFGLPSQRHLEHMALTPDDFDGASGLASFREEWKRFLDADADRGGPIVAAWSQGTLDLLGQAVSGMPSRSAIKGAYRSSHSQYDGSLEDVAGREGWSPEPLPFKGRAAARIGSTLAVAKGLNRLAQRERTGSD